MTFSITLELANILQPLIDVASAVLKVFYDLVGSWGLAIILLTVVTRALLVPLTYKQLKSMRRLQAYQPQIKELQKKFKNDRQRLSQEMMNFYKENKINPLASCIPLLAQMPIFIALFWTLKGPIRLDMCGQEAVPCGAFEGGGWGEAFLGIPDLTAKATGTVLVVLVILYVGSQLISGIVSATSSDRKQQLMIMALPIVFVPFIIQFPAGLVLYWITTNIWTIGQHAVINRIIPVPVPGEAGSESGVVEKAPPPPPRKKKRRR